MGAALAVPASPALPGASAAELQALATVTHAATMTNPWPGAVALAGDRVVWVDEYWTSRTGDEGVGYAGWSAQIGTPGPAQRLFLERSAAPFLHGLWNTVPAIAGTPSRVVVTTGRDDTDVTDNVYRRGREVRAGPPAGPLSDLIADGRFGISGPATQAPGASGDDVIAIESVATRAGLPYRAVIRSASGGAPPQPIGPTLATSAGTPVSDVKEFMDARIAGSWAAVNLDGVITVLDRTSGASAYTVAGLPVARSWDLQADGSVALVADHPGRPGRDLAVASLADPERRILADGVMARGIRIAGGRVAFRRPGTAPGGRLLLIPFSGGPEQPVSDVASVGEFDFDGRRVAFVTTAESCVYVGDAPPATPATPAPARAPCAQSALDRRLTATWKASTRTLVVTARCRVAAATGCHGAVTVSARTRRGHVGRLADRPFSAPAGGRAVVTVRLSRSALARIGASRRRAARLQVAAITTGWTGAGHDLELRWTDPGTTTSTARATVRVR